MKQILYYEMTIYFGHKVKLNFLIGDKGLRQMNNSSNDRIFLEYRNREGKLSQITINKEFVQLMNREVVYRPDVNDEYYDYRMQMSQTLEKYDIASVTLKEL